jgi:hypothetical protein
MAFVLTTTVKKKLTRKSISVIFYISLKKYGVGANITTQNSEKNDEENI